MIILSPVLPDVKVQLRVAAGGITLDDGTLFRELTVAGFDALGRWKIRFIIPASVKTNNCHTITIIQGGKDLVGTLDWIIVMVSSWARFGHQVSDSRQLTLSKSVEK